MVSKSPRPGVVGPLPNGLLMAYKWGTTNPDLDLLIQCLEKFQKLFLPNGGFVIYYGRIRKKSPYIKKNPRNPVDSIQTGPLRSF